MRDSLNRIPGIAVRALDLRPYSRYPECMLHTKYIITDAQRCVVGSHNWSYSAFADNRELSLLVQDTLITRRLRQVFETDWQVAGRESLTTRTKTASPSPETDLTLVITSPDRLRDPNQLSTADALRELCGQARKSLDIEVNSLTTRVDFGDSRRFNLLDSLLRRAADNGVHVRLLVDKWAFDIEPRLFQDLNDANDIAVRVLDISELGPLPGTGSAHAKLMIADTREALLGSATLSQRQIVECRNAGLLVRDPQTVRNLQKVFNTDWNSGYSFSP
jgi:phosphatidylserine/phosphatidylglycerophosphate/cardiolipin synthase-like enzyme